jgi:hypothetical protein
MSKTHVIDGVTYVEVDRIANVGEKVLVVESFPFANAGEVHTIRKVNHFGRDYATDKTSIMNFSRCVVLEPLEETPDINDLLANLARRVASLERQNASLESQLRDTQRNLETFAEQTERNTVEIAMLDNRTYSLTNVQSADGILHEIERLLKRRSDCR